MQRYIAVFYRKTEPENNIGLQSAWNSEANIVIYSTCSADFSLTIKNILL